jgi:hypothetical protein
LVSLLAPMAAWFRKIAMHDNTLVYGRFKYTRRIILWAAGDSWRAGGRRRFARGVVLGRYEGSRDKAARKVSASRWFFPDLPVRATLCRASGADVGRKRRFWALRSGIVERDVDVLARRTKGGASVWGWARRRSFVALLLWMTAKGGPRCGAITVTSTAATAGGGWGVRECRTSGAGAGWKRRFGEARRAAIILA